MIGSVDWLVGQWPIKYAHGILSAQALRSYLDKERIHTHKTYGEIICCVVYHRTVFYSNIYTILIFYVSSTKHIKKNLNRNYELKQWIYQKKNLYFYNHCYKSIIQRSHTIRKIIRNIFTVKMTGINEATLYVEYYIKVCKRVFCKRPFWNDIGAIS